MTRQLQLILSACALLALISCGSGSSALPIAPQADPQQAPGAAAPNAPIQSPRNSLNVRMPVLTALNPGAEFDVILSAQFQTELYQGCGRLAYDSKVVRPVSAQRGAIPTNNVFVAKLNAPPVASVTAGGLDGVVPFAFTGLPGTAGFGSGPGELLRVRFKLLTAPGARYPISLLNVPEYLQLRGTQGQRLSFDLDTEVASK
jgi:hypothetical protein